MIYAELYSWYMQGVAGALDTEMSAVLREGLADAELRARLMSLTKAAEANGGTEG